MLIVKGVNIFPMQIGKTLMAIPQVGTNYQIILETENFLDKLIVRVEVNPEYFDDQYSANAPVGLANPTEKSGFANPD